MLQYEERLAPLFEEGWIGGMRLRNRFVQAPLFTQYATTWGEASDRLIEYHRVRARGGVGLIITENTSVDWEVGRTVGNPIRIDHDRFRTALHDLVEAVHNEGAKIAVQLHHTGRQNSQQNTERNEPPIAPTAGITSAFGTAPRAIELEEIPELVDKYRQGARRAVAAGFDAVELHGAHGYLLGQFLSPKTNHRTDEYGGSLENRARFALEVARAVREEVGPDFPVLYRLSAEEPYEGGLPLEEGIRFCEMLEPLVDALDVSAGNYDTAMTLLPMVEPGSLIHYAKAVRARVDIPVIGVGRLAWKLEEAAEAVDNGEFDFVSLGRSQFADPETVRKTRRGEPHRVRPCLAVNECISRWMFAGLRTQCVTNPELSQEKRAKEARRPAAKSKRVLVVGGGPSGCEAARLSALRGHDVTLVEKADRLGGQLVAWSATTYLRAEIERLIQYYENELSLQGVDVRLGTEVSSREALDSEVVLLATGTVADGDRPEGALDAVEMLGSRRVPEGDEVTVFGNSETAMYAALWLAEQGKKTVLQSPAEQPGVDSNDMLRGHLAGLLDSQGVEVKTEVISAASEGPLVWAQPRVASADLHDMVDDERVLSVGNRQRGGRLYEATQSGYWTAARI